MDLIANYLERSDEGHAVMAGHHPTDVSKMRSIIRPLFYFFVWNNGLTFLRSA